MSNDTNANTNTAIDAFTALEAIRTRCCEWIDQIYCDSALPISVAEALLEVSDLIDAYERDGKPGSEAHAV